MQKARQMRNYYGSLERHANLKVIKLKFSCDTNLMYLRIVITPSLHVFTSSLHFYFFQSETPVSDSSKRPQVHEKVSNLSAAGSGISAISDHSENTIGVLHGVSLPLGTQQNQTSKTVSFDDDTEEFNEFTIWGKNRNY